MRMKYIKNISLALIAGLVIACSEDLERADYVTFQGSSVELVTPETGTGDAELLVFTTQKSGSDRTFSIVVDPSTTADAGTYTVPTTVTVPGNSTSGNFTVQANASNIGKKIVLTFVPEDGSTITGPAMTVNIYEECLQKQVFLDIKFDIYSEEFAWQIYDENEDQVAGNDGFGEYPRSAFRLGQIRERICLPPGNYIFVAYDQYGDGLADGTNLGFFALRRVSDGAVLASGQGAFDNGAEIEFTLPE